MPDSPQINNKHWSWWRHEMETFPALLALCAGNSPVTGEFPAQRPVARNFDVFFDLRINDWVNNREAGDLRRYRAHYDDVIMAGEDASTLRWCHKIDICGITARATYLICLHGYIPFGSRTARSAGVSGHPGKNVCKCIWSKTSSFIPNFTGHVMTCPC